MKAHIRFPMRESFAYVEVEVEVKSAEEAIQIYKDAVGSQKSTDKKEDW
jgi:hypothetical protein